MHHDRCNCRVIKTKNAPTPLHGKFSGVGTAVIELGKATWKFRHASILNYNYLSTLNTTPTPVAIEISLVYYFNGDPFPIAHVSASMARAFYVCVYFFLLFFGWSDPVGRLKSEEWRWSKVGRGRSQSSPSDGDTVGGLQHRWKSSARSKLTIDSWIN